MKILSYMPNIIGAFFFLAILFNSCDNRTNSSKAEKIVNDISTEIKEPTKKLRHIVLFKFNDDASALMVNQIEQKFVALSNEISQIHSLEWGINNSPEGLDKELTHCFLVTFLSEKDRDTYLSHPKHQRFVSFIGSYVEDVTVVDYWTK